MSMNLTCHGKFKWGWAKSACDQGGPDDRNHHQRSNYSIVYGWLPLAKTVIWSTSLLLTRGKAFSLKDGGE